MTKYFVKLIKKNNNGFILVESDSYENLLKEMKNVIFKNMKKLDLRDFIATGMSMTKTVFHIYKKEIQTKTI